MYDEIELVGGRKLKVHTADKCAGQTCVVHNPSDHHMRSWPLSWRGDRYLMERMCEHGVGHPDPDHIDFIQRTRGDEAARCEARHGCDGCCAAPHERSEGPSDPKAYMAWVRQQVEQACLYDD